ncbi:hypothetical protein NKH18_51060 [Streptomyces sp. M10(2022)]
MNDGDLTLGAVLAHLEEQEPRPPRRPMPRGHASRNSLRNLRSSTASPRRSASPARPCWRLLHTRAAALNLRRLIRLGLTRAGDTWCLIPAMA